MSGEFKNRLRRRLLGRRLQEQLRTDHRTVARLGNRHYYRAAPDLTPPGFKPAMEAFEFGRHSQNGEDGVVLELLARIGVAGRHMVEIGIGDGCECNSANLILNFGWQAALFEADVSGAVNAKAYFHACGAGDRVRVQQVVATPDNINELLLEARAGEDVDVLSIDIDSYDYWLWRAVDVIHPRLVVIEYNASLGSERCLTVPYPVEARSDLQGYHGASLAALTRLAGEKGYLLAGCESRGINAFFVRDDLARGAGIEPVSVEAAFRPHYWRSQTKTVEEQFNEIAHLPWIEIQ